MINLEELYDNYCGKCFYSTKGEKCYGKKEEMLSTLYRSFTRYPNLIPQEYFKCFDGKAVVEEDRNTSMSKVFQDNYGEEVVEKPKKSKYMSRKEKLEV